MPKTRINPDTGVREESNGFGDWSPIKNDDGHSERINPDTGVCEESNGFGDWSPVKNDDGHSERINTDTGVREESNGFGDWSPVKDDDGYRERINPDSGVREESYGFDNWSPVKNDDGYKERINPDSGVREESYGFDNWSPVAKSGIRLSQNTSSHSHGSDAINYSNVSSYGDSVGGGGGVALGIILVFGILVVAVVSALFSMSGGFSPPLKIINPAPEPSVPMNIPLENTSQPVGQVNQSPASGNFQGNRALQTQPTPQPTIYTAPFSRDGRVLNLYVNGPTAVWADGSVDVWADNNSRHVLLPSNSKLNFPNSRIIHAVRTSPYTTTLFSQASTLNTTHTTPLPATVQQATIYQAPLSHDRSILNLRVNGPTVVWSDGSVDVWSDNNSRHFFLSANSSLKFLNSRVIHAVPTSPYSTMLYYQPIQTR